MASWQRATSRAAAVPDVPALRANPAWLLELMNSRGCGPDGGGGSAARATAVPRHARIRPESARDTSAAYLEPAAAGTRTLEMAIRALCVAGARPNFVKIAPILRAFRARPSFRARLVPTGQPYDERLSQVFFEDLGIPRPYIELAIGSASHAVQTAEILRRFEAVLDDEQPHVVLVVGDVNSTIGCALATAKF